MLAELWGRFLRNVPGFSVITGYKPIDHQLEIGLLTDKGLIRAVNQDNIGVFQSPDSHDCIAVVADGMGGHQAGDIASLTAIETIQQNYIDFLDKRAPDKALRQVFELANRVIFTQAQQNPEYHGMGTKYFFLLL